MFVLRERRCFGSASTVLSSLHTSLFGSPHVSVCICTSACPSMSKFASCLNIGMCRVACGTLSVVNLGTCHDPTSPVRRCRHFFWCWRCRASHRATSDTTERKTYVGRLAVLHFEVPNFSGRRRQIPMTPAPMVDSTAGLDQTVGEVALEDVSEPCRKSLAVRRT